DTLFGATYMVLAPEHPMVKHIITGSWPVGTPDAWKGTNIPASNIPQTAINAYRQSVASKTDLERTDLAKEKTGVFTGGYAVNPVNNERIPIWIADYVLMGYGTGAIMAVPAHDERDWEFAKKFDLPMRRVVQMPDDDPNTNACTTGDGVAINSDFLDGRRTTKKKKAITAWLEENGRGAGTVNFKLRDWLFSRQRYWGEPFPIVWESQLERKGVYRRHRALPESELPIEPPALEDFKPTGTAEPPLAKAVDWVRYSETARRETNTMPQWAGSSWYYLRFCDPKNRVRLVGSDAERYWMGGDSAWRADAQSWPQQLDELWLEALVEAGQRPNRAIQFAPVNEAVARRVSDAAGFDVSGFWHLLDVFAIRHIVKAHGRSWTEAPRGQIAVTIGDLALLPQLLAQPDTVEFSNRWHRGMRRLIFSKRINGTCYVVEEVRGRRQQLRVVTFYKRKESAARDVTPKAPPSITSETLRIASNLTPPAPARKPAVGGVDLYVGGTEHAVLHLLYARFWHKVLFDRGYVSTPEPFQRLVNQGLILGEDGTKMSKSRGNVINPEEVVADFGADSLRLFEMFMGPLEQTKPWSTAGVQGVHRFLARVWRLFMEEDQAGRWHLSDAVQATEPTASQLRVVHATIKKVSADIDALAFNTAISAMMVCVNEFTTATVRPASALRTLLVLLNPFAPHLTEELNARLGERFPDLAPAGRSLAHAAWPTHDEAFLVVDEIELPVQINGKVRERITVKKSATREEVEATALALPRIAEHLAGRAPKKVIVVPGKLVNIVV
ncbi:MAG: class I tRNA ligase family protein, partial [Verrucomicrobia bacterium]|nr:class I tRNA ligase family protein [Verrucomicrobiota bacterium]